ncbi:hypothetical protein EDD11_003049 [Mortierella claussenii]|nr:hypothetical protein EDD11_003049 [Mortierella claussenii]
MQEPRWPNLLILKAFAVDSFAGVSRRQTLSSCTARTSPSGSSQPSVIYSSRCIGSSSGTTRQSYNWQNTVRARSRRIAGLPKWRNTPSQKADTVRPLCKRSATIPIHSGLLDLYRQKQGSATPIQQALEVSNDYKNLAPQDFMFILEIIQNYSCSQEEFWESMVLLVRHSPPFVNTAVSVNIQEWKSTLAYAVLEVYWGQDQAVFMEQVERAKKRIQPEKVQRCGQLLSDAEMMSHFMVDSLSRTYSQRQGLELYGRLCESGIEMPARILETFVRVAVSCNDGQQLERIGNMLLKHEDQFQRSVRSANAELQISNRPLAMSPKLMDTFIEGACASELYELARAVFDRGLEAGQRYRAITFTRILNSYSVKDFGFDIVSAAVFEEKRARRARGAKQVQRQPVSHTHALYPTNRAITVANPQEIEKYVTAMQAQDVQPNMTTLNVLVKLFLEMNQYRVPGAPNWKLAFTAYNPLNLQPDVVTYNTLLAYYEKHRDLTTMKRIYDDMAGTLDDKWIKSLAKVNRMKRQHSEPEQHGNDDTVHAVGAAMTEDRNAAMNDEKVQKRPSPSHHIRSHRDIYTYNTMLHALLQHAVDTKDIASIGQCFHDMELDGVPADTVTFNANIMYHISRGDVAAAMQVYRSMDRASRETDEPSAVPGPWSENITDCVAESSAKTRAKSLSKPIKSAPSYESYFLGRPKSLSGAVTGTGSKEPYRRDSASSSKSCTDALVPPPPDVVTLTSLITGFGRLRQMDRATEIFKEMTNQFGIEPNLKTYSALAAGLHRSGDHQLAEQLWDMMLEEDEMQKCEVEGLADTPKADSYNVLDNELHIPHEDAELRPSEQRERLQHQSQKLGRTKGYLTTMERQQVEFRRKLYQQLLNEQ